MEINYVPAKTIVTPFKNGGSWFGADYNMNIYRGCSHRCIYCDSRSECYHIDDFSTVSPKADALRIIRDELNRKVRRGVVATGAMSDPYNPLERELLLTRHALELLNAYGFGCSMATKGTLITRDIDVLSDISEHSPVIIKLTVTTPRDDVSRIIEPNAPPSGERLEALCELTKNGVYAGVLLMPVLPFITDSQNDIIALLRLVKEAGGRFVYPGLGVTMRDRQRQYFMSEAEKSFPGIAERYKKAYGTRYHCAPPKVRALYQAFTGECERLGLLYSMSDIIKSYKLGYSGNQLSFY